MNFPELRGMTAAALLLIWSPSAFAQDWEIVERPEDQTTVAFIQYEGSLSLAARCTGEDLEFIVSGLPDAPRDQMSRTLRVSVGDEPMGEETWSVGERRSTAFSRVPAQLARRLAVGGRLQVGVPGRNGQPGTRYVMELPPSTAALERTLSACGRALVDPRDALIGRNAIDGLAESPDGLPGLTWATAPRPQFPGPVRGHQATQGVVTLTCLAGPTGGVEECMTESEHPRGYDFAREATKAALRASLRTQDGSPMLTPRLVLFTVNFLMR